MAVKILETELDGPLPALDTMDLRGYSGIQMLVRRSGRPLGWVYLNPTPKRFLRADFLRFEIERQLHTELDRAALEDTLGGGRPDSVYLGRTVTVAICTRERPESLERALRSLERLDYPAELLEIIVADNAPATERTRAVVEKFPHVRYVRELRPGLDWARNRAAAEAHGDVVAYTDDDVEVDPRWVRAVAKHFDDPGVMCVTGLVCPAELETPAQLMFERYGGFGRGFEVRYYTLDSYPEWPYWPLGAGIFGTGCNMAYRRSLIAEIGGFDEALDVGTPTHGAGDHDMFYRTLRSGYTLVYEPGALIWHHHRRGDAELRAQLRDFGRGVYAYWTKTFLHDPEMRGPTLRFGTYWFLRWFVAGGLWKKRLARKLVLAEAVGAVQGPASYLLSRRHARRVAAEFASALPEPAPGPFSPALSPEPGEALPLPPSGFRRPRRRGRARATAPSREA